MFRTGYEGDANGKEVNNIDAPWSFDIQASILASSSTSPENISSLENFFVEGVVALDAEQGLEEVQEEGQQQVEPEAKKRELLDELDLDGLSKEQLKQEILRIREANRQLTKNQVSNDYICEFFLRELTNARIELTKERVELANTRLELEESRDKVNQLSAQLDNRSKQYEGITKSFNKVLGDKRRKFNGFFTKNIEPSIEREHSSIDLSTEEPNNTLVDQSMQKLQSMQIPQHLLSQRVAVKKASDFIQEKEPNPTNKFKS